ncbi:MFS transporter [Streptosporangium sp. CA-135522]|uniref:MFS transporter n=1 Tax=Streptosporangium sp. CA-135522 TaxID=3240072 RepID=UPI003D8DF27F
MSTVNPRRWWALVVLAAAQFMVIMDTSIIGVALPDMQRELGFTDSSLQWVFNAYVVAFGGLLLLGGKLSDLVGARKIFTTGWVVLTAGSVIAAAAGTAWVEILGRAVQGVGGALIAPAAMTLLMMLFGHNPRELGKAMSLYGAAAPAGGTAGVFLGGVITEYLSWPWVFIVYIPIGLATLAAIPALLPKTEGKRGSVDWLGAIAVTAGVALAVYAIVTADWLAGVGAVVLLVAFLLIQRSVREPLMPLAIWKTPGLTAANLAMALLGAAWIPMWYFLNLYLQKTLGYGSFASGAALLPMTVAVMIFMVGITARLLGRFGAKPLIVLGLGVLAVGIAGLSLASANGSFVTDVLPASLIAAVGMSLAYIPAMMSAMSGVRPEEAGLASGIVNTTYNVGSALGLAVMTAIATGQGSTNAAFVGAAVVAAIGVVATVSFMRRPKAVAQEAQQPAALA